MTVLGNAVLTSLTENGSVHKPKYVAQKKLIYEERCDRRLFSSTYVRHNGTSHFKILVNAAIAGREDGKLFSKCWNNRRVHSVPNVGISCFIKK
jgi:hypothetical protein